MTLYEIEDTLAERRPGLTREDILKMPFYELTFKLNIIKKKDEERKKEEEKEKSTTSYDKNTFNPEKAMKQQLKAVNFKPNIKMPKI
jgi:hypothetical protein